MNTALASSESPGQFQRVSARLASRLIPGTRGDSRGHAGHDRASEENSEKPVSEAGKVEEERPGQKERSGLLRTQAFGNVGVISLLLFVFSLR